MLKVGEAIEQLIEALAEFSRATAAAISDFLQDPAVQDGWLKYARKRIRYNAKMRARSITRSEKKE